MWFEGLLVFILFKFKKRLNISGIWVGVLLALIKRITDKTKIIISTITEIILVLCVIDKNASH